jgi:hypothetical protein
MDGPTPTGLAELKRCNRQEKLMSDAFRERAVCVQERPAKDEKRIAVAEIEGREEGFEETRNALEQFS